MIETFFLSGKPAYLYISRFSGRKLKADDLTLMHYSQYAFSKNGLPTIMVKQDGVCVGYIIRLFTNH